MRIKEIISKAMSELGKRGRGKAKARSSAQARAAARVRWDKVVLSLRPTRGKAHKIRWNHKQKTAVKKTD